MILYFFKFYCFHLCSYKLCIPVLDYYQMIFNFLFFLLTYRQTYMSIYTLHNMFPSFKTVWCIGTWIVLREGQVQFLLLPRDTCLHWISTFYVQNSLLVAYGITPNNYRRVLPWNILHPHFVFFFADSAWRTPKK